MCANPMFGGKNPIQVLCITGPESTGKSELTQALSAHFGGRSVPEFARTYLEQRRRPYLWEDLAMIARDQHHQHRSALLGNTGPLFLDTDGLTLSIWSQFKYGRVDPVVEQIALNSPAQAYLLCDIDLPWEDDPLREHPDKRSELFEIHHNAVLATQKPFRIVRGLGAMRFHNALAAVQELGLVL